MELKSKNIEVVESQDLSTKETTQTISAPITETKIDLVTASFQVTGTMAELKSLGAYMKNNGITYKNLN